MFNNAFANCSISAASINLANSIPYLEDVFFFF